MVAQPQSFCSLIKLNKMSTFKFDGKITIDPHDPKPTFIRELEPEAAMVKENRAIFRPTLWKSPNGIFMKVKSITITATGSWVLSVTEMYAEDAPVQPSIKTEGSIQDLWREKHQKQRAAKCIEEVFTAKSV
jgi:hypothetical protein